MAGAPRHTAEASGSVIDNFVPHYDIHGHQHHRTPFKDKSALLGEDIRHPKWLNAPPPVRSRSELLQARKVAQVPHISYDFDGDGVVGQLDHFIGRSFDSDYDGRLTAAEQKRARRALKDGFLDRYVRGLDSTGPVGRSNVIQQKNGVIMTGENPEQMNDMHPPHHNADRYPAHATKTAMEICRAAELKASAVDFGERLADACAPVDEPRPPDSRSRPRACPISNIRERAEADHQLARVRGGLFPDGTPMNPEREYKSVGLGYVEAPVFATRCQLMETRKELNRKELADQRARGEDTFVELEVQKTIKEARQHEFRRPDHVPMTATQLKDQRRQERIEHNMANFQQPRVGPREYPKFSDNAEVPFWAAGGKKRPETAPASPAISRAVSEPTLKVTEVSFGHSSTRPCAADLPEPAVEVATAAGKHSGYTLGTQVVKRWTADLLERRAGLNKPRMFDKISPARVGPKDLESLDLISSLEPVRTAARRKLAEAHSAKTVKRSALWQDTSPRRRGSGSMSSDVDDGSFEASRYSRSIRFTRSRMRSPPKLDLKKLDNASEPRFFGSPAHIQRPTSQTGVRTGGFDKFRLIEDS